jgi:hypothetical protein
MATVTAALVIEELEAVRPVAPERPAGQLRLGIALTDRLAGTAEEPADGRPGPPLDAGPADGALLDPGDVLAELATGEQRGGRIVAQGTADDIGEDGRDSFHGHLPREGLIGGSRSGR